MVSKTVVVICAHTDDEALGCGGILAKHRNNGDNIFAIFLADGVTSRVDANERKLQARKQASEKAGKILGIKQSFHLGFEDNKLDSYPLLNIVKAIEIVLQEIKPEIVYTHHIGDLNIDHRITHQAVMTACRPIPGSCVEKIYCFEILSSTEWQTPGYLPFIPNTFIDIKNNIEDKIAALKCYDAEMCNAPHSRSLDNVINLAKYRGNSVGVELAEALMLVRHINI